jgi:hypothetical protein
MRKDIKDYLVILAEELYENSKNTIGEVFEMDIEELDYPTLEYESSLIIQLAKMVEILDEAEKKNELDSVDDKLDFRFIKDEFENREELRKFLHGVLCEPNLDLDEFEEVINNIVKLMYK